MTRISDYQLNILRKLWHGGNRLAFHGQWCGDPSYCIWEDTPTLKDASVNKASVLALERMGYVMRIKDDCSNIRCYHILITNAGLDYLKQVDGEI